jgi:hypothetical protein
MPQRGPQWFDVNDLVEQVKRNLDYYNSLRSQLERTSQTALDVEYEMLRENEQHWRMLNYLEVDPAPVLEGSTSRMNRDSLRSLISNYDALKQELAGTDLQQDLSRDENV